MSIEQVTKKRSLVEVIASDEPNLRIILSGGVELPAHRDMLAWVSSCARGLPPGGVWDLSTLVVDGKAVERATVVAWLEVVYLSRGDEHVLPDSDAAGVLSADLLAFADAVGSCQSVLDACIARWFNGAGAGGSGDGSEAPCTLEVEDGGQRLRLRLDGTQYQLVGGKLVACISGAAWPGQAPMDVADPTQAVGTEQQLDQLRRLIAAQAERLLHLAYKLNLRGLQRGLHLFLQANALPMACFAAPTCWKPRYSRHACWRRWTQGI